MKIHKELLDFYRQKQWNYCEHAIDYLMGKWNGELDAYRAARAQGIQPAGTSMAHVKAAVEASNAMGSAYDADTAIAPAQSINKKSIASLSEVGAI